MKYIVHATFWLCVAVTFTSTMYVSQPATFSNAQADPTESIAIHIVQANETLSQIAAQYGITVETLIAANNITDARFIEVGQQLLIPNSSAASGSSNTLRHTVQLGDTLASIAANYAVPAKQIITRNHIVHPNRLYVGQSLIIGEIGRRDADYGYYIVQADDTALRIVARFGMSLDELITLNHLSKPIIVFEGQQLLVRGATPQANFPAPLTSLRLTPATLIQGQSISVEFSTLDGFTVTGEFLGRAFTTQLDNNLQHAVLGVHSFTTAGVYSISLTFEHFDGTRFVGDVRLLIDDGGYGNEAIDIPPDRANLLEPTLVQNELDQVAAVMSGFNPTRYFDGVMLLPATGPITSNYGTRRSYNGSPYNTFHGGTDFGGGVGAPIIAPAAGVVVMATPLVVRGNVVILDHGWGVYTGYWHLSQINVEAGQQVQAGEVIGLLGATGLVTGAHLHWEMWVQGVQVNPMQWVEQSFP